jgi:hypothetical protein
MEAPIPNSRTATPPVNIKEAAQGLDRKAEDALAGSWAVFLATDILVFLSIN